MSRRARLAQWIPRVRVPRRTMWRVGTGTVRVTGAPATMTHRTRQQIADEDDEFLFLMELRWF